eukprot:COSAG05_NODE_18149_length_313_cov_0.635514_1_plen_36_part_01
MEMYKQVLANIVFRAACCLRWIPGPMLFAVLVHLLM